MESEKNLLHIKGLAKALWAEAVNCAVYTLNRVSTRTVPVTPYEAWYGRKPNLSHLKVFDCDAFVHIPKGSRQKLDKKKL